MKKAFETTCPVSSRASDNLDPATARRSNRWTPLPTGFRSSATAGPYAEPSVDVKAALEAALRHAPEAHTPPAVTHFSSNDTDHQSRRDRASPSRPSDCSSPDAGEEVQADLRRRKLRRRLAALTSVSPSLDPSCPALPRRSSAPPRRCRVSSGSRGSVEIGSSPSWDARARISTAQSGKSNGGAATTTNSPRSSTARARCSGR